MIRKSLLVPVFLGLLVNMPATAQGAATLSGTITNISKTKLSGIQVRLWALTKVNKRWAVSKIATTNSSGLYSFTALTPGTYKLDARMPAKYNGYYVDRWYDVAKPTAKGYVGIYADAIAIKNGDALKGYDIILELGGGLTCTAAAGAGILSRAENRTDPRINHMDVSLSSYHNGKIYYRGLPAGAYRLYYHHPDGEYETLMAKGPYTVKASTNGTVASATLKKATTDPYEPNNKPLDTKSSINSNIFHQTPPVAYTTSGAMISKRNSGDTDWTCFNALKGDRFIIEANSTLSVDGKTMEHPWVDPYLVLYHLPSKTSPPAKVKEDDDSGTTTFGAKVDSGLVKNAGRYCAQVTTYGDTTYVGKSQGSAGRYTLNIKIGNRMPALKVNLGSKVYEGAVPPAVANYLSVKDGDKVSFTATFTDPDKDTLSAVLTHVDSGGKTVSGTIFKDASGKTISPSGSTFAGGNGGVTFSWEVSQTAGKTSPYELKLAVKDAEHTVETTFVISVVGVNNPPTIPVPLAPLHKAVVTKNTPALEIKNSTDVDGDLLKYEYEIYQGSWSGKPIQTKTVAEAAGGKTTLVLTSLKENTWFYWRVRADDGNTSSNFSPWCAFHSFFVNSKNEPPTAPLMVKPADKSTVYMQNPVLSAKNPTDPDEFGTLTVFFELAEDVGFTKGLFTSPGGVKVNTMGLTTSYKVPTTLTYATTYYVRAYAKDSLGLQGPYSNINEFKLLNNPIPDNGPEMMVPDSAVPDTTDPGGDGTKKDTSGSTTGDGTKKDTNGSGTGDGIVTPPGVGDDDGCSCRTTGDAPAGPAGLILLLGLALALRRRRR